VLVEADSGRGLLTDFGIALAADSSTLTAPDKLLGTPAYMAPETLMGGRATAESDLWALGAVAYRVATGTHPRGLSQPPEAKVVPPSLRNDRLGADVDRVILRALSFAPSRRYGDACAFVCDLREALDRPAHRTTSTRRLSTKSPERRRRGPRRRVWGVTGAALVVLTVVAYGVASLGDQPGAAARSGDCHPSYTGACLKPDSGDYDCKGGEGNGPNYVAGAVRVVGPDVYGLDGDGDGHAC
jgi:hypothetical protein